MTVSRSPIDSGWVLSLAGGPAPEELRDLNVPGAVPGSVHTDLLAAGLIPDPYLDSNERVLAWIGLCDWRYTTEFRWEPGDDVTELVFSGLDTVATVRLNGVEVARTRNMHRTFRVPVHQHLRAGSNTLQVDLASAIRYADEASLTLGYRPHVNHHPFNAIRKMACSFGWDWGIDTATAGIWRAVTLERWSVARITEVRPVTTIDADGAGVVRLHVTIAGVALDADLSVRCEIAGTVSSAVVPAGATEVTIDLRIPDVRAWWPRGYGSQPLYDVEVTLLSDGEIADRRELRTGFRTVELDTTPDHSGTPFVVRINGERVYIKGANWIPDDAFPHRVDRDRYARRLEQAEFAGINLLRVWGGGIYESDDFFDLCDERGILTWQDFLLACAAYAEENPLRDEIEAEAREAVSRLARHPSLVLFNGNNENLWGHEDWNWKLRLDGKSWGAFYYHELFPAIVSNLAPHVVYTPGSPFTPDPEGHPNDPSHGTTHIWDLWNVKDHPHYRDYRPRFVAEFGWQAPPTWATLTRSIHDSPLTPESPGMLVHQKAVHGNAKLTDGLVRHLRLPDDMADWVWAMQLNQADAITTAVEHLRSLAPHCSGSIVWQLNDCWPVTSWAAVDGDGRPKPLLYALRHAHADRLVTIQPTGSGLVAFLVNDSAEEWAGPLRLTRLKYDGTRLVESRVDVVIPPRSVHGVDVPAELSAFEHPEAELLSAATATHRGLWFPTEYRDSALEPARIETHVAKTDDGYELTVTAHNVVRSLILLADRIHPDAVAGDGLITLLPGESTRITVTTTSVVDPSSLTAADLLRSANQLVSGSG